MRPLLADGWIDRLAVALITPSGREVYTFSADPGRPTPRDALFEIGSISKVYNALILATAVAARELTLETPVSSLWPAAQALDAAPGPVTLEHLATHTAGLPRLPATFAPRDATDPYADFDDAALVRALATTTLEAPPGERYAYSNLGAGLLGRALAERFERSWEALLRERVLAPLGLSDTHVSLDAAAAPRLVEGHTADGVPTPPWAFDALAGAGALRATIDDAARFLEAQLHPEATPLEAAIRLTQTPRHPLAGGGHIALGWHVAAPGALWHNGGTGGFRSFAAIRPQDGLGVVVLASSAASQVDALGGRLLGLAAGRPAEPLSLPPLARLDAATLDRCAGRYALEEGGALEVSREGGHLVATFGDQAPLRLFPETATRFRFRAFEGLVDFEFEDSVPLAASLRWDAAGERGAARRLPTP